RGPNRARVAGPGTGWASGVSWGMVRSGVEVAGVLVPEGALAPSRVRERGHGQGSATVGYGGRAAPAQRPLRHGQGRPPARRADPLVVLDPAPPGLVGVPEAPLHLDQVLDVHARRESVPAAPARRRFARLPLGLVEAHAELRGALED